LDKLADDEEELNDEEKKKLQELKRI